MQRIDAKVEEKPCSARRAILSFIFEPAENARADIVATFYEDLPKSVLSRILSANNGRRVLSNRLLFDKVMDHGPIDIGCFDEYPAALTLLSQEQLDCFFLALALAEYDEVMAGSPIWPGTRVALKYLKAEGLRACLHMRRIIRPGVLIKIPGDNFSLDSWRSRAGSLLAAWWYDLIPAHRALFSLKRGEPGVDRRKPTDDADRTLIRDIVERGAHVW